MSKDNAIKNAVLTALEIPEIKFFDVPKKKALCVIQHDGKLRYALSAKASKAVGPKAAALEKALKAKPIDIGTLFRLDRVKEYDESPIYVLTTSEGAVFMGCARAGEDDLAFAALVKKLCPEEPAKAAKKSDKASKDKG